MEELILWYVIVSTIFSGFMFVIWKISNLTNAFIAFIFAGLTVGGVVILLNLSGYAIKLTS